MLREAGSSLRAHFVKVIRKNRDRVFLPLAHSAESASLCPSLNPVLLCIPLFLPSIFDFPDSCLCLPFRPPSPGLEAPRKHWSEQNQRSSLILSLCPSPPPSFSVPPLVRSPLLLSSPQACRGLDHCASLRAEMESANSVLIAAQLNQEESSGKG